MQQQLKSVWAVWVARAQHKAAARNQCKIHWAGDKLGNAVKQLLCSTHDAGKMIKIHLASNSPPRDRKLRRCDASGGARHGGGGSRVRRGGCAAANALYGTADMSAGAGRGLQQGRVKRPLTRLTNEAPRLLQAAAENLVATGQVAGARARVGATLASPCQEPPLNPPLLASHWSSG